MAILATLNNRQIVKGVNETPVAAVPEGISRVNLRMSRAQWPAEGATITIFVSYDDQKSWVVANRVFIEPGETSAKDPVLADAVIGFGWGKKAPTHIKAGSDSPVQFRSNIVIEAD